MKKLFFLAVTLIGTVLIFSGCKEKLIPMETRFAMDTVCTVNAYDDGTKKLYDEVFLRLEELENKFSVTIETSEISQINKNAGISPVIVSNDVLKVIETAIKIAEFTDGAFNPAAQKLISLWGINTENARVPELDEIAEALEKVDWKKIVIGKSSDGKNTIFIEENGIELNLGGIAKGYAADCIAEVLKKNKVKRAIIDLGGNIYLFGEKAGGVPWTAGIKNPLKPEGFPLLKIKTGENSVVTSGVYERFLEKDGIRFHHIFDTKTGFPCDNGLTSVTILCKSSLLADACSTAFFVYGKEKTMEKLSKIEETFGKSISVVFIDEKDNVFATKDLEEKMDFYERNVAHISTMSFF